MTAAVSSCSTKSRAGDRAFAARARVNYWADVAALAAAILVFATGLLLLTFFHMGHGPLRGSEFGVSRLAWVDIHRFGAIALLAAIAIHVQIHWRAIAARIVRAWRRLPGGARRSDLALYAGFAAISLTGLIAWFVAPGSPPVLGPASLGRAAPERHVWIDLHNLSGFIALPAAIVHVRRHLRWMLHACGIGK
jgi:hypothetical protein